MRRVRPVLPASLTAVFVWRSGSHPNILAVHEIGQVDGAEFIATEYVIYEMVGGRRPFEAATQGDVIVSVLEKEPLPLRRARARSASGG